MPKSLIASLIPLIAAMLSAWATKKGIDAKTYSDQIWTVATAAAGLIAVIIGFIKNHLDSKKIKRAETIVPGITSIPKGSEVQAKVIVNDPTTPDPPTEIVNETKNTP